MSDKQLLFFSEASVKVLKELHDIIPQVNEDSLYFIEKWIAGEEPAFYYPGDGGWHFEKENGEWTGI